MADTVAHAWECSQVILRFFRALDESNVEALLSVVAKDGVWVRQGTELAGHAAIRDAFAQRPANRTTLHLVTNLVVDVDGAATARATSYLTVHAETGQAGREVCPAGPPKLIAVSNTDLRRDEDGWKILTLRSRPIFRAG